MSLYSLILTSVAALAVTATAHATTFSYQDVVGAAPTFSVTSNGVTATYTSSAGNGFQVQDTTGLLTFNTGLVDNNFFGTDPLTVSFSSPVGGNLSVPFAILDSYGTGDAIVIATNTGQIVRFSAIPDNLALGEPEGVINLALNTPIQSFTLTSTEAFAVGNISSVAPTPEPGSFILLATGLAGIVLHRRRRWFAAR